MYIGNNLHSATQINLVILYLDLKQGVLQSDHQLQQVSEIDQVFDVKNWMKPQIETPSGHSNPHNFLFRLGETGKAEMFYRNWSSDEWIPKAPEPGLQLLKVRVATSNAN